jgi:predicted RNA-binding protein with PUA-like domain
MGTDKHGFFAVTSHDYRSRTGFRWSQAADTRAGNKPIFICVHPCPSVVEFSGMNYWLVKQEPEAYSWADLVKDGGTHWTGVRSFAARKNLRAMKAGDRVFFYHSGEAKSIVGLARVTREAYPDPTAGEEDWSAVDLAPVKPLNEPVTLSQVKSDRILKEMVLVKQSRLSVMPLTGEQFTRLLELSATKI